jgi:acyl carrier protein
LTTKKAVSVVEAAAATLDVGVSSLDLDATMSDLGIDSLVASQFIAEVEMSAGVELPDELLEELSRLEPEPTLGEVVAMIEGILSGQSGLVSRGADNAR